MEIINEKIIVKKDLLSRKEALNVAKKYILEKKMVFKSMKGFIYIVGPTISDLFIISSSENLSRKTKRQFPQIRPCTDAEWNKYFLEFLDPIKEEDKIGLV